jgi:hypothetical protein
MRVLLGGRCIFSVTVVLKIAGALEETMASKPRERRKPCFVVASFTTLDNKIHKSFARFSARRDFHYLHYQCYPFNMTSHNSGRASLYIYASSL